MNAKQYKPLVSILTLVYNHSAFIGQTIDSVLTQTFQDWEWIILDDGSVDGTGAIIKQIEDSRIHYCFQEHAGFDHLTRTYNKALAMCRGDFIALLDGDDYWPEYKLEIQLKSFKDPDAVLSYGECFVTYQEGKKKYYVRLPENPAVAGNDPRGSALKHLLLDKCCFLTHPTVMLRKSTLLNIGGFVEAKGVGEDFPTWVRLSLEGRFAAIPRCLGYYRKYASSVSATQNPVTYFDNELNFLRDFILKNDKKLKEVSLCYDMNELERRWGKLRIKAKIIYLLRNLSSFLKIDLVNLTIAIKLNFLELLNYNGHADT
jgi:glycosyltransferase involved in cell wall biosynthesis